MTGQKIRYIKVLRGVEQVRETRKRKIKPFLLENVTEIIFQQPQSAVERDQTTHKLGLGKPRTIALSRI